MGGALRPPLLIDLCSPEAPDIVITLLRTGLCRTQGLKFGVNFSDHMLLVEHVAGQGWGAPRLVPFGPLAVHPAAQVLHYGMSCFEGMKAYKGPDGRPRLFRSPLTPYQAQPAVPIPPAGMILPAFPDAFSSPTSWH